MLSGGGGQSGFLALGKEKQQASHRCLSRPHGVAVERAGPRGSEPRLGQSAHPSAPPCAPRTLRFHTRLLSRAPGLPRVSGRRCESSDCVSFPRAMSPSPPSERDASRMAGPRKPQWSRKPRPGDWLPPLCLVKMHTQGWRAPRHLLGKYKLEAKSPANPENPSEKLRGKEPFYFELAFDQNVAHITGYPLRGYKELSPFPIARQITTRHTHLKINPS